MERMEKEQIFVLRVTKQDTGLEIVQTKKNRQSLFKTAICEPGRKNQINSHQQKDLSPTIVFVYVDPYSHELKILPTIRLAHQFQNMKYVGILKSFCNKYKINSPQNTISVESQTEKYSMQIDNTSVSD